jgi:hypothetical protein
MIELEFKNVDFCGGRKTGEPGEKPSSKTYNTSHNIFIIGQKMDVVTVRYNTEMY